MKKRIALIMVVVAGLSFILPASGFSWPYGPYGYRGYYGGGCCYGDGWGWGAAIAGGLVAGLLIGTIIADQDRRSPPPPRVTYPAPAYAYPDPEFIAKYGAKPARETPTGEWVTVPGQWAGAVWVPEHRVWIAREGGATK